MSSLDGGCMCSRGMLRAGAGLCKLPAPSKPSWAQGPPSWHGQCTCRWREVQPEDKDLRRYRDWLEQHQGLGTGLTRHRTMPAAEPAGPTDV